MKADHFLAAPTRIAAALLVGLLFAAVLPAAGQAFSFGFGKRSKVVVTSESLAVVLARQVAEVEKRFTAKRRALPIVRVTGHEPAYPRAEVLGLIAGTRTDLVQAIGQVGEPGLSGLSGWAEEEIGGIEQEAVAAPVQAGFEPPGRSTPYAVTRVADLSGRGWPVLASLAAAPAQQETLATGTADRLLDRVGAVVGRILFLAEREDLEVKVWVGSTPSSPAVFSFWPQGKVKGSTPKQLVIRTNGKKNNVLRGLYAYRASWAKGAVAEIIQFPPTGAAASQKPTERLDLVNGSGFFCCHFNEQFCEHVSDDKECRP